MIVDKSWEDIKVNVKLLVKVIARYLLLELSFIFLEGFFLKWALNEVYEFFDERVSFYL